MKYTKRLNDQQLDHFIKHTLRPIAKKHNVKIVIYKRYSKILNKPRSATGMADVFNRVVYLYLPKYTEYHKSHWMRDVLRYDTPKRILSTLLHEIGHCIQYQRGSYRDGYIMHILIDQGKYERVEKALSLHLRLEVDTDKIAQKLYKEIRPKGKYEIGYRFRESDRKYLRDYYKTYYDIINKNKELKKLQIRVD